MSFVLSNLDMNNLSNDLVSTIKQLCRWCAVIFHSFFNAKTWTYELNSKFKNKSEWTLCHFMNSDLKKQAQDLKLLFWRKTKSYLSQLLFGIVRQVTKTNMQNCWSFTCCFWWTYGSLSKCGQLIVKMWSFL